MHNGTFRSAKHQKHMLRHDSGTYSLPLIALICCVLNLLATSLNLLGWVLRIPALEMPLSPAEPLVPLTALCVMILTVALLYLVRAQKEGRVEFLCAARRWAAATTVIVLITLGEYLFKLRGGLESLLFADRVSVVAGNLPYPGRLAPQTALSLLVFCLGIFFMSRQAPHAMRDAGLLIALGMIIPGMALIGHLIDLPAFHTLAGLTRMSTGTPTAAMLLLLGAGALALSDPQPHLGPR